MHDFLQGEKIERIVDIFNTIFTGAGNNLVTLAPYVSSQSTSSTRTESSIFDQVYGGYRRRPAMISLNVQWMPLDNRSGAYQLSGSDVSDRKVKTVTFFGTGEMRGQQQAKVITPPGSDYTDAYLSAFASKSIPTRHVHRLRTSVFDNSTPIPLKPTSTPISTSSSIKTSQTRLTNTNNVQTSNLFDKPTPSSSSQSSTYSSSFVPERSTTYEPLSNTQYSTPQSQTFTSSYSTLLRSPPSTIASIPSPSVDSQRSYSNFQTRSQLPSSSTYPTIYRTETVYENIYKPLPPYSIQTYPPSNTYTTSLSSLSTDAAYKPYVPSESFQLSSPYDINQSSASERIILPTTKIEKQIDRPETLLFQHDEDIRSPGIEKPSPIINSSPESPLTREELKVEPERLHMEELPATTSEPIKILENTLSKYDSLINQISEVLASVSPLSSTVSSMSPGKSVLDYQLSSDTSPILSRKPVESDVSQQSTTTSTAKSSDTERTKASHLIREDSYDKIVTAISDLDNEIISPSDNQKSSPTIKEEKEETKTPLTSQEETKILSSDEDQALSVSKEETEEIKPPSIDEYQTAPIDEEEKKEETQTASTDEQQTSSTTEDIKEETKTSYTDEQAVPSVTEEATTSPAEEQQVPLVSEEEETKTSTIGESETSFVTETEKKEETTNVPEDEHQAPSSVGKEKEEEDTKTSFADEQATSSVTEEGKEETKASQAEEQQVPVVLKEEETKTSSIGESETSFVTETEKKEETTNVPDDEHQVPSSVGKEKEEEDTKTSYADEQATSSITEEGKEETKASQAEEQQVPVVLIEEEIKTSLPDESQAPPITEEEKEKKTTTVSLDEHSSTSPVEETKEETTTSSTDEYQLSAASEEETKIESSQEHQTPPVVTEEKEETKISLSDEQKVPSVSEEPQNLSSAPSSDTSVSEILQSSETKSDEEKVADGQSTVESTSETSEFVQEQTGLLTNVPNDVPVTEKQQEASVNATSTKKTEKHVRWDETVVDNEDEESSSCQSLTEESSTPVTSIITTSDDNSTTADELETTIDQQLTSSDIIEPQISFDQNTQSAFNTDSFKEDTFAISEVPTKISDTISNEDINKSLEEPEAIKTESKEEATTDEHKVEASSQAVEGVTHESETSVIESTTGSLQPTISSPIDTLDDTVSNRYISSDVYHGYLGEHQQFLQDTSDVDNDSTTKSLIASLRETITAPITPLIETIQSVVSSMQTTHPSKTEDETSLTTTVVSESAEEVSDDKTQVEEDESTADTSEKLKTVFENLREAVITPITAITETIQTAVSNLQSDKQEVSSTSDTEQLKTSLDENVSTAAAESSSDIVSPSDEKTTDHSNKEIEQTQSSLLDSIQETVSKTITTLAETIQHVVSTEKHTEDEQAVQQKQSDIESSEHSVSVDTIRDQTMVTSQELSDSFVPDTTISTSLDSTTSTAELDNEQKETASAESLSSEIPDLQKTAEPITESVEITPINQHDEQVLTASPITLEQANISDKQETIPSEISSETPAEPKLDENASTETKTTLQVIRDVITHPLEAISDKIQSIIPSSVSEQTASDATETSKEQQLSETENAGTIEQKTDSIVEPENTESSESKTTLETIRDVITHPLATITEKIQSFISSSTTQEIPSSEKQTATDQNKSESITSTVTESTSDTITNPSTTVNETVDDVVSNTTDQTSSSQEKEQILTNQESEVYSQDQIQGEQEISSINIPSQISDNEKTKQITDSESEPIANTEVQDSVSLKTDDATTTGTNQLLVDTIRDLINDTINTVISNLNKNTIENEQINQDIFSSNSSLTSPITVLNVEDRSESSQSTINQEQIINENDITWNNLLGEKSSDEKTDQSYEEIVQPSDNTTSTVSNQTSSLPTIENTTQQTIIIPQINDVIQRSSNEFESDSTSAVTEIEKIPSTERREPSLSNTEDDSLELIHALHGHSIIHPSSSTVQTITNQPSTSTSTIEKIDEKTSQVPERSSSSTTSSQITSSDRYVSYAIHEMGDSSQERLPAFPLAADIPVYKSDKTTSDENKEHEILSEPIVNINQNITKDDDLTELDATENLTSYSDDNLLQKLNASAPNRQDNLDASSTDEDVDDENFNELDQHDTSNLQHIIDEITQKNNNLSGEYEPTYQRYDVSTTSSTSTKQQTDDVYAIPGYPGLWKPSADDIDDDNNTNSSLVTDADDEDEKRQSPSKTKTRTIVRTTNPTKLQSFLQQQHQDSPLRPDTIDIFNRPLNEFSFDVSESDSFKTCPSTINSSVISKQQKQSELFDIPILEQQEHQISPDEKIFLIRERERGVSLPVTMKIDYDNMDLRLSSSTPFDAQLYSASQTDLPSPSTHSEPMQKTTTSSRASTPSLSSNESEQPKPPSSSWLNTVNTVTTTTEGPDGPLESRTTIHKSAKGPISIAECDPQGKFIIIENTSRSKSIALVSWTIRQESDNGDILTFTFPDNCLLRPNQSLKVFTKPNESERRNSDLIASLLSSWHTGSNVVTTLINAEGKDRASLTKKTLFS